MVKTRYVHSDKSKAIIGVIANALSIPLEMVKPQLSYQSINQWDSLGHIKLMLALERHFNIKINQDRILELTSVEDILEYLNEPSKKAYIAKRKPIAIKRGLNNVYFDESLISFIDAEHGDLYYRGYKIDTLLGRSNYEEIAYLILYGILPTERELEVFKRKIKGQRFLPDELIKIIHLLYEKQSATDVLRTVISSLSSLIQDQSDDNQVISYIAKVPLIIGICHSLKKQLTLKSHIQDLSQAEYLYYMLTGNLPDKEVLRIFENSMILQLEHDSNASAFSARVSVSTGSSIGNGILAAVSTFCGPLHGGAIYEVVKMINEIGDISNVKNYLENRVSTRQPIYGFGHRVYRTEDPRAEPLRQAAEIMSTKVNNKKWLSILEAVKQEMSEFMERGIHINVDFYACISYLLMGIDKELFVPLFIANRVAGWGAHILEQRKNNILIRPRLKYAGEINKDYTDIKQR